MVDENKIEQAVRMILEAIGENPGREGLLETPRRVAQMYKEVFSGLHHDPRIFLQTCFVEEEHNEMVIVKDISLTPCVNTICCLFMAKHILFISRRSGLWD